MNLELRTDRHLISAGVATTRYVLCEIRVPRAEAGGRRVPIQVGFVLDRSGSMSGVKFEKVREAARRCLSSLGEQDRFSLVVYDNEVDVLTPACHATAANKARALDRLDSVFPGGNTDLGAGWLSGCEQVGSGLDRESVGRCLLLTDGLANNGIISTHELARHAAELRRRGVVTSTFGVGADFNETLLQAMADSGGGHFYFIADPAEAAQTMNSEVGEAQAVVVRDAVLQIRPDAGISVESLSMDPTRRDERASWVPLGDLVAGQVLSVVFEVHIPAGGNVGDAVRALFTLQGDAIDAGAAPLPARPIEVRWTRAEESRVVAQRVDREVLRAAARAGAAQAREEGLGLNREGDFRGAADAIRRAIARLMPLSEFDRVCDELVRDLEREVDRYGMDMDPMARKLAYFSATSDRRGRDDKGKAIRYGSE